MAPRMITITNDGHPYIVCLPDSASEVRTVLGYLAQNAVGKGFGVRFPTAGERSTYAASYVPLNIQGVTLFGAYL